MTFNEALADAFNNPSGFSVAYVCGLVRREGLSLDEMMQVTARLKSGESAASIIVTYATWTK